MNFFIDFEATQYTNEIISIGCVAENGETFYSEVNCEGKITPFITNLTGLTEEQISNAPSANRVFENFELWIMGFGFEIPKFYVFGNSDAAFIKATLNKVTSISANRALCLIYGNMIDYSKIVEKRFNLTKQIGLVKLLESYKKTPIKQKHNSLQDAFFLQEVFNFVKNDTSNTGPIPFEYLIDNSNPKSCEILRDKRIYVILNKGRKQYFKSIETASNWVISLMPLKMQKEVHHKNVEKKVLDAAKTNGKYTGRIWGIE